MARPKNSQAAAAATTTSPTRVTVQTTSLALVRNTASNRNNPSRAAPIPAATNESVTVPLLVSMLANESQSRFDMTVIPSDQPHAHYGPTPLRWPPRSLHGSPHRGKLMRKQGVDGAARDRSISPTPKQGALGPGGPVLVALARGNVPSLADLLISSRSRDRSQIEPRHTTPSS